MTFKRSKCPKCQTFSVTRTGNRGKDENHVEVRCDGCKFRFQLRKPAKDE